MLVLHVMHLCKEICRFSLLIFAGCWFVVNLASLATFLWAYLHVRLQVVSDGKNVGFSP